MADQDDSTVLENKQARLISDQQKHILYLENKVKAIETRQVFEDTAWDQWQRLHLHRRRRTQLYGLLQQQTQRSCL